MTTPEERAEAVHRTRRFLVELLDAPRIPRSVREKAMSLLRHYPMPSDPIPPRHASTRPPGCGAERERGGEDLNR